MIKKCIGCGKVLQCIDKSKDGYIREDKLNDSEYCERCFKLKYYGKTETQDLSIDSLSLLQTIKKSKGITIYLCDLLNLTPNIKEHLNLLDNNDYIILTKRDALPKSVKDEKLIKYFKENFKDTNNIFIISSLKKMNIDVLLNTIKKDHNKTFYIVGNSNSGKSTLINALLESIGTKGKIVTSRTLNTTLDNIEIDLTDKKLIDTPGFTNNTIENYLEQKNIKKLQIKKEIKVKTVQLKPNYSIYIEDFIRLDYTGEEINSFSFYMSNALNIKTKKIIKDSNLEKIEFNLNEGSDIAINGLGFIKAVKPGKIIIYTPNKNIVSIRKNII